MTKANMETVNALLKLHADDGEMIDMIIDMLESFEKYHQAIYALEIRRQLFTYGAMDQETYREKIPELDRIRTGAHNTVITNVKVLNRMAEQAGLPPFCEGTVSTEHPYRTELADAVMEVVREIIDNRAKGGR